MEDTVDLPKEPATGGPVEPEHKQMDQADGAVTDEPLADEDGPIKSSRPDGTPIPGDKNPPPVIRRGPPKGWKCAKNGHIADEDFPPGGPVVKTKEGTFFGFPTGRCIACECIFALKQEVKPPTGLVKADGSPQPPEEAGGLIKP